MLETTHFAGQQPNRKLVYELRQHALHGAELPALLALIANRMEIPDGDTGRFAVVVYLRLAFGVGIAAAKEFAANIQRAAGGYIITDVANGDTIKAQIEANRSEWSDRLRPDQS